MSAADRIAKKLEATKFADIDGYRVRAMKGVAKAMVDLQTAISASTEPDPAEWESIGADIMHELGAARFELQFMGEEMIRESEKRLQLRERRGDVDLFVGRGHTMSRMTRAERQIADGKEAARFEKGLARATTWDEVWSFAKAGPPSGKPGGQLYTDLCYFMRFGKTPFGAPDAQVEVYRALVVRLGELTPRGDGP